MEGWRSCVQFFEVVARTAAGCCEQSCSTYPAAQKRVPLDVGCELLVSRESSPVQPLAYNTCSRITIHIQQLSATLCRFQPLPLTSLTRPRRPACPSWEAPFSLGQAPFACCPRTPPSRAQRTTLGDLHKTVNVSLALSNGTPTPCLLLMRQQALAPSLPLTLGALGLCCIDSLDGTSHTLLVEVFLLHQELYEAVRVWRRPLEWRHRVTSEHVRLLEQPPRLHIGKRIGNLQRTVENKACKLLCSLCKMKIIQRTALIPP